MNELDLDAAVRSRVIAADQAGQLRAFVSSRRGTPAADEERFRLFDGLNDLMTAAGFALLFGIIPIFLAAATPIAGVLLMGVLWALAEKYTRRKRLALTSAILFLIFVLAAAMTMLHVGLLMPALEGAGGVGLKPGALPTRPAALPPLGGLVVAAGSAFLCAAWWLRFRLPIAFAAIVLASVNVIAHVTRMVAPDLPTELVSLFLLLEGLIIFAIAMWWDISDIRRETRRSDVAFWLHAMAGFQIAGASFRLLFGVAGNPVGWDRLYTFSTQTPGVAQSMAALLLFVMFCAVALVIDRRSLVMSSLAFVFLALTQASGLAGPPGMMIALTLIGLTLVVLSGLWTTMRAALLEMLPAGLRAQLPRTDIALFGARPVT